MATGIVGGNVSFYCTVEANPAPTIIWLVNGTILNISSGENVVVVEESIDLIVFNSSLSLLDIDLNDIGMYSCNASSDLVEFRSDVSEELDLEVLCKCVHTICL